MARLVKGKHVVTTSNPREIVQLKAQGYRESEGPSKSPEPVKPTPPKA